MAYFAVVPPSQIMSQSVADHIIRNPKCHAMPCHTIPFHTIPCHAHAIAVAIVIAMPMAIAITTTLTLPLPLLTSAVCEINTHPTHACLNKTCLVPPMSIFNG